MLIILKNERRIMVGLVALFMLGASSGAAFGQATITRLNAPGAISTYVNDISNGQQVGRAPVGSSPYHASLWSGTAESWVDLNPNGAGYSIAFGVSGGHQVGLVDVEGNSHASLWSGTAESWVDLHPYGARSRAFSVGGGQQVGEVAVDYLFGEEYHASLWTGTAESWVDLHPEGLWGSTALGVSGGQQVGVATVESLDHASLWSGTAESWVDLHPEGAFLSRAFGVGDGQQVGAVRLFESEDQASLDHASLWTGTAESWVDLHPRGALRSRAFDVGGGQQVGVVRLSGSEDRASLWSGTAESWKDLNTYLPTLGVDLAGWNLTECTGISEDGKEIVGNGTFNGVPAAWLVRLCSATPTALHQCDSRWANRRFIPQMYDEFLANTEAQFRQSEGRDPVCPPAPGSAPLESTVCDLREGQPNYQIRPVGCELTAYAIMLRFLGVDRAATPVRVHDKLASPIGRVGFVPITRFYRLMPAYPGCGGPGRRPKMKGGSVKKSILARKYGVSIDLVDQALPDFHERLIPHFAACRPVMIRLGALPGEEEDEGCHHWVVATAQRADEDGLGYWYYITDPGSHDAERNGWLHQISIPLCPSTSAVVMQRYNGRYHFIGQVNSPVRTTLTDPQGRRVVVDSTGILTQEIHGVGFQAILPNRDLDDPFTSEELEESLVNAPYVFTFEGVVDGSYQIELVGTGDGEYSADFSWFGDMNEVANLELEGTITTGQIIQRSVSVVTSTCTESCDDEIDCTFDECVQDLDAPGGYRCAHTPDNSVCNDDNDLCTVEECANFDGCVVTSTVDCSTPPDTCHGAGTCDQFTGACHYPPLPAGEACTPDPADLDCANYTCNDAGLCLNQCDPVGACCHMTEPNGELACVDGVTRAQCDAIPAHSNHRTWRQGESCPDPYPYDFCLCGQDADCDDGLYCNGADTCDLETGLCNFPFPPPPVVCGSPHCAAFCSETFDQCVCCEHDFQCNDFNNPCTQNICSSGTCTFPPVVCPPAGSCYGPGMCNPFFAVCEYPRLPQGTPCTPDPADPGCSNYTCDGFGGCVNRCPMTCDDGDACTTDSGTPPNCVFEQIICDDDDACTMNQCDPANGCDYSEAVVCVDGDACTVDECDPATGCDYSEAVVCDDDDACTVNACDPTTGCDYSKALECDDADACTVNACDPAIGCDHSEVVLCDDHDACTVNACDPAIGCDYSKAVECDDHNACTVNRCDPLNGCDYSEAVVCADDGNLCNGPERCDATIGCTSGPALICPSDGRFCNGPESCHPTMGCVSGPPPICNDATACTADSCDVARDRCVYTPNHNVCSDELFCNGAERCASGLGCMAGVAPACGNRGCDEANNQCRGGGHGGIRVPGNTGINP